MTIFSPEIEQNILGTFMMEKAAYFESLGKIKADDFHDPLHAHIFELMAKRFDREELVSPVTLRDALAGNESLNAMGGPQYLVRLANASVSHFAIMDYVKELRKLSRRRNLHALLAEVSQSLEAGEAGPDEVIGKLEASLILEDAPSEGGIVSMLSAVKTATERAAEAHQSDSIVGVPTGIADLDKMTGGLQPGLILLGGRPSMGKTAVALSMAAAAARKGVGVAISSLEMTPDSLALRLISNEAAHDGRGMAYTDAQRGTMTEDAARAFFETSLDVGNLPIEVLPSNMRDMGSIYAGVRKAGRILEGKGTPLGLIIVDYLQLISDTARDRFQQIAQISIALKGLSMKTGVPVLALSQLSRALESRDNKRPMLSDLRESGQLEQDADMVIFAYRGEYYLERDKPENDADRMEWEDAMSACRNRLELIVAKQRMGAIGTIHAGFNPATNFIWDL